MCKATLSPRLEAANDQLERENQKRKASATNDCLYSSLAPFHIPQSYPCECDELHPPNGDQLNHPKPHYSIPFTLSIPRTYTQPTRRRVLLGQCHANDSHRPTIFPYRLVIFRRSKWLMHQWRPGHLPSWKLPVLPPLFGTLAGQVCAATVLVRPPDASGRGTPNTFGSFGVAGPARAFPGRSRDDAVTKAGDGSMDAGHEVFVR
jgi:hypothetical protein